jgi:ABC-2 type transport system permease protein
VIGLMVVPFHAAALAKGASKGAATVSPWVYAGIPLGLLVGAAATVLPLRAGARALRNMEF